MKKKSKELKRMTVLDLPFDEGVKRLSSIVDDVYNIVNNPNFVNALGDTIKVPANATKKDLEKIWYGAEVSNKVKGFLNVFLVDETESILNILSTIFCEDKEEYRKKSIKEMLFDIDSLSKDDTGKLISFFTRA